MLIYAVPDLDKERPLPIPHLHDWSSRKMEDVQKSAIF
jgi:hypothetical protein